jgi:hypothetical protein
MNGHLARLAVRATLPTGGGLRPRRPSLFEQPVALPAVETAPVALPGAEEDGGAPGAVAPRPRGRAVAAPGPALPTRSAEVLVHRVRATPADAQESTNTQYSAPAQDSPHPRVPDRTPDAASSGSAAPRSAAAHPSASPLPERVVASLVAEAVSAGLRPPAVDRAQRRSADAEPATTSADVPTGAPPATAPLPRLQAPRLPEPARGDRRHATPEVTVNIGRIEVVPPPPEPRKPVTPRPRPRTRASGAPPLADYLRDRNLR